jgi:hypothetical protein
VKPHDPLVRQIAPSVAELFSSTSARSTDRSRVGRARCPPQEEPAQRFAPLGFVRRFVDERAKRVGILCFGVRSRDFETPDLHLSVVTGSPRARALP